ncbi:ABC transporter permease subunit [Gordonia sp. NPDC003424]
MTTDLIRLDLRLRRRMLIGTAVGAAVYLLIIVAMYPSFKNDTSLDAMISSKAAVFGFSGSITSPAGWLNANMYANFGPMLALLLAIGYGAGAIAGQDADGSLGLVVTLPVTRTTVLAHKAVALLVVCLVVPIASFVVCLAGPRFELTPDWAALAGVTLALTLLAYDFGALALLVGAATGNRGMALGVAGAAAAASYLISSLAMVINAVHAIRWISPFYWSVGDNQLVDGVSAGDIAALLGLAVVLVGAAVVAFRRLDVH